MNEPILIYSIKGDTKFGSILIAVLGLLASLWAKVIFISTLKFNMFGASYETNNENEKPTFELIFTTVEVEFILVCGIAIGTMLLGVYKRNRKYLLTWAVLKICECIVLSVGSIILFTDPASTPFVGLIPIALIALVLNYYLMYCVYIVYMKIASGSATTVQHENLTDQDELINDEPPSYEETIVPIPPPVPSEIPQDNPTNVFIITRNTNST